MLYYDITIDIVELEITWHFNCVANNIEEVSQLCRDYIIDRCNFFKIDYKSLFENSESRYHSFDKYGLSIWALEVKQYNDKTSEELNEIIKDIESHKILLPTNKLTVAVEYELYYTTSKCFISRYEDIYVGTDQVELTRRELCEYNGTNPSFSIGDQVYFNKDLKNSIYTVKGKTHDLISAYDSQLYYIEGIDPDGSEYGIEDVHGTELVLVKKKDED